MMQMAEVHKYFTTPKTKIRWPKESIDVPKIIKYKLGKRKSRKIHKMRKMSQQAQRRGARQRPESDLGAALPSGAQISSLIPVGALGGAQIPFGALPCMSAPFPGYFVPNFV